MKKLLTGLLLATTALSLCAGDFPTKPQTGTWDDVFKTLGIKNQKYFKSVLKQLKKDTNGLMEINGCDEATSVKSVIGAWKNRRANVVAKLGPRGYDYSLPLQIQMFLEIPAMQISSEKPCNETKQFNKLKLAIQKAYTKFGNIINKKTNKNLKNDSKVKAVHKFLGQLCG